MTAFPPYKTIKLPKKNIFKSSCQASARISLPRHSRSAKNALHPCQGASPCWLDRAAALEQSVGKQLPRSIALTKKFQSWRYSCRGAPLATQPTPETLSKILSKLKKKSGKKKSAFPPYKTMNFQNKFNIEYSCPQQPHYTHPTPKFNAKSYLDSKERSEKKNDSIPPL